MSRPLIDEVTALTHLPGLVCWYRAETVKDKFSDGELIDYLLDESGSGNNVSALTTARPTMVADGCNGYATSKHITGDGFQGSFTSATSVVGAFAVVKSTSGTTYSGTQPFISGDDIVNDLRFFGSSGTTTIKPGGAAAYTSYVNGTQTTSVTTITDWNLIYMELDTADTIAGIDVGRDSSSFFVGEIAECGIFTSAPSATQRTAFFDALMTKYGIS